MDEKAALLDRQGLLQQQVADLQSNVLAAQTEVIFIHILFNKSLAHLYTDAHTASPTDCSRGASTRLTRSYRRAGALKVCSPIEYKSLWSHCLLALCRAREQVLEDRLKAAQAESAAAALVAESAAKEAAAQILQVTDLRARAEELSAERTAALALVRQLAETMHGAVTIDIERFINAHAYLDEAQNRSFCSRLSEALVARAETVGGETREENTALRQQLEELKAVNASLKEQLTVAERRDQSGRDEETDTEKIKTLLQSIFSRSCEQFPISNDSRTIEDKGNAAEEVESMFSGAQVQQGIRAILKEVIQLYT
ncbi:unnamed protein product [Sphagnum jensenii]|uniref:Uncharacterized protein n=1 Tax=Sphagnum jensenii TaxID=128206 RepID=A0ABP0V8W0_9BRYO